MHALRSRTRSRPCLHSQTPLPLLLVVRILFAVSHVLALRRAWVAHSVLRASCVYLASVLGTVGYRLRQVQLYLRTIEQQAAEQQRNKAKAE